MVLKRNWFATLTLVLFEICLAYALFSAVLDISGTKSETFLWYGGIICGFAAVYTTIHFGLKGLARLNPTKRLPTNRSVKNTERLFVAVIILISAALRTWVIIRLPIEPSSDYETYYQVAVLLSKNLLGASGYSGYIAEFPHVIGYPFILSLLFRITGPSLQAGLYLNMAAGLFSIFLTYKIARLLGGRLCGFAALLAAAFWPSQILYGAVLASEPVFTCMLLLCIRLFIYMWKYPVTTGNIEGSMFLCVIWGIMIALTAAVRPLAEILLIAALISLLPLRVRFDRNERMLSGRMSRIACQGWFRGIVIVLSYFISAWLISGAISNTIAYELPGSGASFGYNLMVGVNIDAKGAWNQEDADYFANEFELTNSAEQAHKASVGVALQRIGENPLGVANLAFEKFTFLWGNDDYASYWTTLFLDQQGELTPDRNEMIQSMSLWNGYFYLLSLFFSAALGLRLLRRKTLSQSQVLILLFLGTVLLHMILESQNRYHYFILPVFIILASIEAAEMYRGYVSDTGQLGIADTD